MIKVGAVLLRGAVPEVLIIQPKPKHAGETPLFVLPRGSRQYALTGADGADAWQDARDLATAQQFAESLEPVRRTLRREIHEEAGLAPDDLARAQVVELGARDFASRSKGVYPIHWFLVLPDAAGLAAMAQALPSDTMAVRWEPLETIRTMVESGEFSAGYMPIIEEALAYAAALN